MSSSKHKNTAKPEASSSYGHGWSPQQAALIYEVKRYYPHVVSEDLNKVTKKPFCNWRAISEKMCLSRTVCSTDWSRIRNKYTKLIILLQSGKITHEDISNNPFLQKYFDGSLKFLNNYCLNVTDADLPGSINKWGNNLVHKIEHDKVLHSQKNRSKCKIITHDQVKEMLSKRETEKKDVISNEDEDIYYLQRTIQNMINYKLNEFINGNTNTFNKNNKNTNTVITIDSDSEEDIEGAAVNLDSEVTTDDAIEQNVEDAITNETMAVGSTINKDYVWEGTIQNLINYKLGGEVINDNSNTLNNKLGKNNNSEENIEYLTVFKRTIDKYGARKKNCILENKKKAIKLLPREVMLKDDIIIEENIMDTNTNDSMGVESTINTDEDYEDNIPLHNLKRLLNKHNEVILEDDDNEEQIEDATTNETMEVESRKNKDDVWVGKIINERTINEYDAWKEKKPLESINLHSEVILTHDIKKENIETNTLDENEINRDDACEQRKRMSMNLHSEVILKDDIKEEIEEATANETEEVENTINKDNAWEGNTVKEDDACEKSKGNSIDLHSEIILPDDIKEENTEKETSINVSMEVQSPVNKNGVLEVNKKKAMKFLHSEIMLDDVVKEENIIVNSIDERMEVESKINEDGACEKSKGNRIDLHSEIILPDNIKEENTEEEAFINVFMDIQSSVNKDGVLEENKKKAMKFLHSEIMLDDDVKEENIIVNSIDERMEVESTINEDDSLEKDTPPESSNLINNVEEKIKQTSSTSYDLENNEEFSDKKVRKFFKDLYNIISVELSLEKQEELKSRINEVIKKVCVTPHDS
ncbi:general transcriptional corepressor trfA-like isoform X2 [Spodoptera litura]|uniref:General transcriptional corepressor trfA-like isoform X2 n=1 Tax=Spodoptera litura TaxID=69820 RepID=A0A9J7E379_SPOLT|nr:general transcriptional corepressor trfA-like isoform X2 [Spodoptera litura]